MLIRDVVRHTKAMDGVHGQRAVIRLVECTAEHPVVRRDVLGTLIHSNQVEVKRVPAQTEGEAKGKGSVIRMRLWFTPTRWK